MRLCLFLLAAGLSLAGCTYPPANIISEYPDECATGDKPTGDVLLFVTERVPNCTGSPIRMTKLRGSELLYGGSDAASVLHIYRREEWIAELRNRLNERRVPLVFVHGFNNGSRQALKDAIAIQKAVQPQGEVIAFTWPSYHHLISYTGDEANADWATDGLLRLISELGSSDGIPGRKIMILAHSMGNRIALDALKLIPENDRSREIARFIMASPDVDRAKVIADAPQLHIPVTIYGSTKDQALSGSWRIHGLPRAGDLSSWISGHTPDFALSNSHLVDVVDTSAVTRGLIHHTDYIETAEGAADLCRVVNDDDPDAERSADPRGLHWRLIKGMLGPPMDQCAKNGAAASAWLNSH